ncbi:MAG: flagellar hook-basal body complex protein [Syntrophomonadaceae bacterium]|jgi:flagellar hook-basal body protein
MMRSLYAGVSGLRNHQTRMDVIGNNIANVNTTGFKKSRVVFKDMLYQNIRGASSSDGSRGGTNPMGVGLGMALASIDQIHTGAPTSSTAKLTDLAIDGNGYFVVNDGNTRYYTRAGAFDFDEQGNLNSSANGYKVQGWLANPQTWELNTNGDPVSIDISGYKSLNARATTQMQFTGNLDSGINFTPSQNEWQSLAFSNIPYGGAAGGQFRITFDGQTTGDITVGANPNNTALNIQKALEGLPKIGAGNVAVSWDAVRQRYDIKFQGVLEARNHPEITFSAFNGVGVGVTETTPGDSAISEVQTLDLGGATGGTYTLTYEGIDTPAIPYDAPATGAGSIQEALETIPALTGNVAVADNGDGTFSITFSDSLGDTDLIGITSNLIGGTDATVTESNPGVDAISEVQTLDLGGATEGIFTLTFNTDTTGPISVNADAAITASNIQTALESLPSIGNGNVSVAANEDGTFSVTFTGTLVGIDTQLLQINPSFTGGAAVITTIIEGQESTAITPQNEIQTLDLTTSSAGTFTLSYEGFTTASIDYNATLAEIQAALDTIPALKGNVTVTQVTAPVAGDPTATPPVLPLGGSYKLEFNTALAGTDVEQLVINNAGTCKGSVLTTTQGQAVGYPQDAVSGSKDVYDSQGNRLTVYYRFFKYEITPGSDPGVTPVVEPVTRWACDISTDPLFEKQGGYNSNTDFSAMDIANQSTISGTGDKVFRVYNIQFDDNGNIIDPNIASFTYNINRQVPAPGSGTANISCTIDLAGLTQRAGESSAWASSQDGYAQGSLTSYSVGIDGTIVGIYDNGEKRDLARVAIASFENPAGLQQVGGTLFTESNNSGGAHIGSPGSRGLGKIIPSSLEMSNVDLSEEFTDMIITQRGFQANSRIITTSDEMLQELVNLKR